MPEGNFMAEKPRPESKAVREAVDTLMDALAQESRGLVVLVYAKFNNHNFEGLELCFNPPGAPTSAEHLILSDVKEVIGMRLKELEQ